MSLENEVVAGIPFISTVKVHVSKSDNPYTYLVMKNADLKEGDIIMLPPCDGGNYTREDYNLLDTAIPRNGRVIAMDDMTLIDPSSDIQYKPAIPRGDFESYFTITETIDKLVKAVLMGKQRANQAAMQKMMEDSGVDMALLQIDAK